MGECQGLDNVIVIVKFIINIIRWIVPIILIVLGTIDLVKATISGKEDEIKKNQQILIKRAIAAVLVFLVVPLVSIIMGWIGSEGWKNCWDKTNGNLKDIFNIDQLSK